MLRLKKSYRYVDYVGIELEGGWSQARRPIKLDYDGSVNVQADWVGELPSPKLRPNEIEKWMTDNYPTSVNQTCGMHVHVSVKSRAHYIRLMDPTFQKFVLDALHNWGKSAKIIREHPFWSRLAGKNRFCQLLFQPEKQIMATGKSGDRYTALNYTWARYRTVECRILSAFKMPTVGINAVLTVVNAFEEFLRSPISRDKSPKAHSMRIFVDRSKLLPTIVDGSSAMAIGVLPRTYQDFDYDSYDAANRALNVREVLTMNHPTLDRQNILEIPRNSLDVANSVTPHTPPEEVISNVCRDRSSS